MHSWKLPTWQTDGRTTLVGWQKTCPKVAKYLAGIHHTTRLRVLILLRNHCALAENRTRAVSDQRNPRLTVGLFDYDVWMQGMSLDSICDVKVSFHTPFAQKSSICVQLHMFNEFRMHRSVYRFIRGKNWRCLMRACWWEDLQAL